MLEIVDPKKISHVDLSIYHIALQKDIPEDIAKSFKADLKLFKPE